MNRITYFWIIPLLFCLSTSIYAQTDPCPKPVSKLQDKDLVGSCEELLIKAEDTDNPADYLVIVKKAFDLAGSDIALKVAAKSAMVEYHISQKEVKEAETLMAEIAGIIKGTTNLYANFKYQYAIGDLLFIKEDYARATIEFQKALDIASKIGKPFYLKQSQYAIAYSEYFSGDQSKALATVNKGIAYPIDERTKTFNAKLYQFQAQIFSNYGDYEKAVEAYLNALKILQVSDKVNETGILLKEIGNHYSTTNDDKNAIDYLKQAIKIFESLNQKEALAECYAIISYPVFRISSTNTEAVGWAEKSYNLAKSINNKKIIARALLALVIADMNFNADSKMLPRLKEGYAIAKELEDEVAIGSFENWLGMYYDIRGEFNLAIPYYQSLVNKAEKTRGLVADELKLNYWKSEYHNYQNIIGCYLQLKDFPKVINSIEQSSGRLLFERISKQIGKTEVAPIEISKMYSTIPANQALLFYGNSGGEDMALLTANSGVIEGKLVNSTMWVKSIENKYKFAANENFEKLRAFKKIKNEENTNNTPPKPNEAQSLASKKSFEDIVNNYRSLLSKPNKTQADLETLDFLGRRFYQLLIKPIEDKLVDKTELVIIPNDVLAFLPYEAFIMTDGRYLVEKYDIRYLPSYSTGQALAQRTYPDTRKPIIAFGNAIYSTTNAEQDDRGFKNINKDVSVSQAESQNSFNERMQGISESAAKGENMSKYYRALGFAWDNLPGTQAEVDAILALQPTATVIKGKDVNKGNVLKMSQQGMLKNYKILHFATHGVVIPEFQELSAIVLTQDLTTDDGYLRASEVAKLNINADFVNLSACETGLGKIYGGEGVVGLTQSFLLAGANSVAVSLWQVSDASTMEFQKELYRLVFTEKMPVSKAINQVKRKFITEGQYKHPFYWAPFVYYGM
jgi:CHAT domain-containing protein/tetratricopeptide (TPR) repeat protein